MPTIKAFRCLILSVAMIEVGHCEWTHYHQDLDYALYLVVHIISTGMESLNPKENRLEIWKRVSN